MDQRLDFDETAQILEGLSTKAQATFMYKMIGKMGPMMLRTIIRYCCKRLDSINNNLPDEHPYKQRYLAYGKKGKIPLRDIPDNVKGFKTYRQDGFTMHVKELDRW